MAATAGESTLALRSLRRSGCAILRSYATIIFLIHHMMTLCLFLFILGVIMMNRKISRFAPTLVWACRSRSDWTYVHRFAAQAHQTS